jgi:hypothetical protein
VAGADSDVVPPAVHVLPACRGEGERPRIADLGAGGVPRVREGAGLGLGGVDMDGALGRNPAGRKVRKFDEVHPPDALERHP